MQKVLSAEEMREVDRLTTEKYGIPSILLMENAAHAAARVIAEKLGGSVEGKSFLILCGKGNNGGDGAALARILWMRGAFVWIHLFGKVKETKGDARINFEIAEKISWSAKSGSFYFFEENLKDFNEYYYASNWDNHDVLIDALFGTGLTRKLENFLASLAATICNWQKNPAWEKPFIVSIDSPSGLDVDRADPIGENVRADLTVTFTAPKMANVFPPASDFNGELFVADIGSPPELIDNSPSQTFLAEREDARKWLGRTRLSSDSYKKTRGTALIVAGSKNFIGAAVLASDACFAAGAGMVWAATPESVQKTVAAKVSDEIIINGFAETEKGAFAESAAEDVLELSEKMNVAALGCGLSSAEETTRKFVRRLVEDRKVPMVLDADGLNSLSPFDLKGTDELPLVLTPHIGEFKRLLGTGEEIEDRIGTARDFARKHNVVLVLKGERSLIAAPDGRVVINPTGNAGVSRAGSGDTLTGIITGFLAQTYGREKPDPENTFKAVVAALYIAGLAGDLAAEKFSGRLMRATNIRNCLLEAFEEIEKND